jgi:hypothetical protein
MKIQDLKSESRDGKAKVSATAIWEDAERPPLEVYYETTPDAARGLRCNPDAFLVAAFLPAWRHGEKRLCIEGEVCPELRQGLETAIQIIDHWYPRKLSPLRIEAAARAMLDRAPVPRAGFFFSGGIDSLATLRANHQAFPCSHTGRVQDGFLVFGLEVDRLASFEHAVAALNHIARDAEINLLPIFTNVRYLDEDWGFWQDEFQGAALASIAHAFAGRLTVVSIASSDDVPNLSPYGSHPLLDPCYSSFNLRIRHDGFGMSRLSKTRLVAEWDVALQNFRVCNNSAQYRMGQINCGECEKCVRTMLALEAIGALERTRAFSSQPLTSDLVQRAVTMSEFTVHYYTELLAPLRDCGRNDLAVALEELLQRKRGEIGWKAPIKRFDRKYFSGHLLRGIKRFLFKSAKCR